MSLTGNSGTLFFIGIHGTSLSAEESDFLHQVSPGGVILFSRNVESRDQVRELTAQVHALPAGPVRSGPLVGIDQEWGPVNRLGNLFPPLPAATPLARTTDPENVRQAAALTGRLLRLLGFDLNFAPVVDLSEEDAANGIGVRSFGTDPGLVTELAGHYLDGLASAGVAGTIKHFPGLGRTMVDSHQTLPEVMETRETLWQQELVPFRRLVSGRPGVPVMVGHGWYPALEPDAGPGSRRIPASLSPSVINGLLRGELGHQGVVLTDDLEMGAVSGGEEEPPFDDAVGIRALLAGADWILICHSKERILAAKNELDRELRGSAVLRRMAAASFERIRDLAGTLEKQRAGDAGPFAALGGLDPLVREMEAFLGRWEQPFRRPR